MSQRDYDPFFSLGVQTQWNAFIGKQGHEENYVDGYIEAALQLSEDVIQGNLLGKRDTLVLPILYSARHSVELALKYFMRRLQKAGVFTEAHPPNHDILSHWELLNRQKLGDETMRAKLQALEPYVRSLAQIDDDGQSFRYATLRDGQQSMEDRGLANIAVIRDSLQKLKSLLQAFTYRLWDFERERQTGSYTQDCSRFDLLEIGKHLPDRADWASQDFADAKNDICRRFSLSNRQFSAALNKLQDFPEGRVSIGQLGELAHLSDDTVELVVESWCEMHPNRNAPPDDVGLDYFNRDFDNIFAERERDDAVLASLLDRLSNDDVADMDTIFYVGRDRIFGEHYADKLSHTIAEHDQTADRRISLSHVLQKTNFGKGFADGLERVGRPDLAKNVRDRISMDKAGA